MAEEEVKKETKTLEGFIAILDDLEKGLVDLYSYRDFFFEKNPMEKAGDKNKMVEEKMNQLLEKFNEIEEDEFPGVYKAHFLYLKGRTYNVGPVYNYRASLCLSKAVKLNPKLAEAWNELGECYWKNKNIIDAKTSFEGALKAHRNKISLRSLSIINRQSIQTNSCNKDIIQACIDLAKEAVSLDCTDGASWSALGNAYISKFFLVTQDPAVMKACLSAYKQAEMDPITRGHSDLYYNRAMALQYDEQYEECLNNFEKACKLDPMWSTPKKDKEVLINYLRSVNDLIKTKGKIKNKRLLKMVQTIDSKMLGHFADPMMFYSKGERKNFKIDYCKVDQLDEGVNEGKVILGKVIGSVVSDNVTFTFAIADGSESCTSVSVYNWADGRGVIIGDSVTIPEPRLTTHDFTIEDMVIKFKSIRVNNPTLLLVNGKKVGRDQFAGTVLSSTYEITK